ncbi:nicotinamide mononucleotide adenylyltransferase [Brevipalpus obovatus]|uniref:nicotinamide mononucleotide adenylyltransferase n=1 Tax=Brevipalpus obovatus TaxID=246614 RepID=UPI003D9E060B
MKSQVAFILCGSFNPITKAHLNLLKWAKNFVESFKTPEYEVIKGIITPTNDLYSVKRSNLIKSHHRIEMVKLALNEENLNWIECSSWEADQREWQRTVFVLAHHQSRLSNQLSSQVHLWLVSGGDLIESIAVPNLWKDEDVEQIFTKHKVLIFPRAGSNPMKFVDDHPILCQHKQNIIFADGYSPNDDSSTKARESLAKGETTNLLHQSVLQYIGENNLYTK